MRGRRQMDYPGASRRRQQQAILGQVLAALGEFPQCKWGASKHGVCVGHTERIPQNDKQLSIAGMCSEPSRAIS